MTNIAGWADANLERYGDYDSIDVAARVWRASELQDAARRLASALVADLGVAPGDRVLLLLRAGAEVIIAARAAWLAGGVVVLGHPGSPLVEVERMLEHSGSTVLISHPRTPSEMDALARRVRRSVLVSEDGSASAAGGPTLEELVAEHGALERPVARAASDVAQISYTSGATGTPKGVVYTHGGINAGIEIHERARGKPRSGSGQPVSLTSLPAGAFGGSLTRQGFVGRTKQVLLTSSDPELLMTEIARTRPSVISLVPSMLEALLAFHRFDDFDCSSLRAIKIGGSHLSPALEKRLRAKLNVEVLESYGTTEAGGPIAMRGPQTKAGSVGRVAPGVELQILDASGTSLPSGQVGELVVKTPWGAAGYFENPDATAKVFQDGWIRTGDIGYVDDDGDVFLLGRSKEIIIQAGMNVYPHDVVDVVQQLDEVKECAVIGVPNDFLGEEAVACVVLKPGSALTDLAIIAHCRRHLEERKTATRVRFFDELPKNALGKVQSSSLREALLAERDAVVETDVVRELRSMRVEARMAFVQDVVRSAVEAELPGAHIETTAMLGELGLTSLTSVRLTAKLRDLFGRPLPATLVFGHPSIEALATFLLEVTFPSLEPERKSSRRVAPANAADPIAVIGAACRLPGGIESPEAFWELLLAGRDAVRGWPSGRSAGATSGLAASFLDHAELFDADFFKLRAQAADLDPQQRLLLEVAWNALEDAGLDPMRVGREGVGVFLGIAPNYYMGKDPLGANTSMAVARLCHFLDFHGPALTVDTSCSASLVALHAAIQSLRLGECRFAIVAGVNVIARVQGFHGLTAMGVLATDGRSKAFDARANGFGRGEGCVALVLECVSNSSSSPRRTRAIIRGSAINHDGRSSSLTAPNPVAQEDVIRAALDSAGIAPADVQYVECHGTGTLLGDPIEVQALAGVFGDRTTRLSLGSVKTNIGHLEAGAGLAGVLKVVLAIQNRRLPASLHFNEPNPHIPWARLPFQVQRVEGPWPNDSARLVAGVSSFGMSGTNAHVVIEEAGPAREAIQPSEGLVHLLPISGRTPAALEANMLRYAEALEAVAASPANGWSAGDFAFTAACGRAHLEHRIAVVGANAETWARRIRDHLRDEGRRSRRAVPPERGMVMLFSGQGSQWAGMGSDLLRDEPVFRDIIEACEREIQRHAAWSLVEELQRDAASSRLRRTEIAQPALVAVEMGMYEVWKAWGVEPAVVIGHSLGELSAAYAAGALTLEDAIRLAVVRGRILDKATGLGRMASAEMTAAQIEPLLVAASGVEIAAVNSPRTVTLSGSTTAILDLLADLQSRGVRCKDLDVDYAFHSRQMHALASELERELTAAPVPTGQLVRPMISTVTGLPSPTLDATYWAEQVKKPVRFHDAIRRVLDDGHTFLIEVGPHPVLQPLVGQTLEEASVAATVVASMKRNGPARQGLLDALGALYAAGYGVSWAKQHPRGGRTSSVPTYAWQHEAYWAEPPAVREQRLAPLLERHTSSSRDGVAHVFETEIDLSVPGLQWLAERGQGAPYPPSAFVELALEATRHAYEGRAFALQHLRFARPLPIDRSKPRTLQIELREVEEDALIRFRIFSRDREARGPEIEHAEGHARLDPHGVGRRREQALDARRRIALAPELHRGAHGFELHPTLFDACVRAVVGDRACAPTAVRELVVHGPTQSAASVAASQRDDGSGGVEADLAILDADGAVVAEINGLQIEGSDARDVLADYLYDVVWRPAPRAGGTIARGGRWIVSEATESELSEALAKQLDSAGARVTVVRRSTGMDAHVDDEVQGIVHVARDSSSTEPGSWSLSECLEVSRISAAAAAARQSRPPRLFIVTTGAQAPSGSPTSLAHAALWGLGATLAIDVPELLPTLVDLDPRADAAFNATQLVAELAGADTEDRIALRGTRRLVARLVPHRIRVRRATDTRELVAEELVAPRERARAFDPSRTILVTGGLGGLGLVVAARLVAGGAKHLALVGRGAPTQAALTAIGALEVAGARVRVLRADVSDTASIAAAIQVIDTEMAPLGGIVHCAGVALPGTSEESLRSVLGPKVDGSWNLHELTKHRSLDLFVLFSSLAGVIGLGGQGAYAAANAFLDALASARRAAGLPALAIAWGAWAETGLIKRSPRGAVPAGVGLLSNAAGAEIFERLLSDASTAHVTATAIEPRQWDGQPVRTLPLLRELVSSRREQLGTPGLIESLARAPEATRGEKLEQHLISLVARVVGVDTDDLDREAPLVSLGLDSLMVLQLRRRIQEDLGVVLPNAVALKESLNGLAAWAKERLFSDGVVRATSENRSSVVELTAGKGPPLVLVHPVGGDVACYGQLAHGLGRRVLALESPVITAGAAPLPSVELIAERYVELLLERAPEGPYLLGGWSFGGGVALEMGRVLRARGADVPLVALVDSFPASLLKTEEGRALVQRALFGASAVTSSRPEGRPRSRLESALSLFLAERLAHAGPERLQKAFALAREGGDGAHGRIAAELHDARIVPDLSTDEMTRLLVAIDAHQHAHHVYQPARHVGRAVLLRCASAGGDPDAGWRELIPELHVELLQGEHFTLLRNPHVNELRDRLTAHITKALDTFASRQSQRP